MEQRRKSLIRIRTMRDIWDEKNEGMTVKRSSGQPARNHSARDYRELEGRIETPGIEYRKKDEPGTSEVIMTFSEAQPSQNTFKRREPDPNFPKQVSFEGLLKNNGQFAKAILSAWGDVIEIEINYRSQELLRQEFLIEDLGLNQKLVGVKTKDKSLIAEFKLPSP